MALSGEDVESVRLALLGDPPERAARVVLHYLGALGSEPLPVLLCETLADIRHERLPRIVEQLLDLDDQATAFPRAFYSQAFCRMMPVDVDQLSSRQEERSPTWHAVILALQQIPPLSSFPMGVQWMMRSFQAQGSPSAPIALPRVREVALLIEDFRWTLQHVTHSCAGSHLARLAHRASVPIPEEALALVEAQGADSRQMLGWSLIWHGSGHLSPDLARLLIRDLQPSAVRELLEHSHDDTGYRSALSTAALINAAGLCRELLRDRRAPRALLDWAVDPDTWLGSGGPERLAFFFEHGGNPSTLIQSLCSRASNTLLGEGDAQRVACLERVVKACKGRLHEIASALAEYASLYVLGPEAAAAAQAAQPERRDSEPWRRV